MNKKLIKIYNEILKLEKKLSKLSTEFYRAKGECKYCERNYYWEDYCTYYDKPIEDVFPIANQPLSDWLKCKCLECDKFTEREVKAESEILYDEM